MKRYLSFLIFVLTGFVCNGVRAQTKDIAAQEAKLVRLYSKMSTFIQADYDSVNFYEDKFETGFVNLIQKTPATLDYPFQKLVDSNFCQIETSADKNFRIYSWDNWSGGTMHNFTTVYQWRDQNKIFAKVEKLEEGDPGSFVSKIFTISIAGKPYYFAVTNAIYSTKDSRQSINVFSINGGKLVDTAKLFKTKTKTLNRIDVDFDFFSVVDRPERPLELITYDDKHQMIYIPVVDKNGKVTSKNILYELKGDYFEFIGIEVGKRK